jgi:hypothetical protein
MIRTLNPDLCLGVSIGNNSLPIEGMPLQIKSFNRSSSRRFHKLGFAHAAHAAADVHHIYSLSNTSLSLGRLLRLTSNPDRMVNWTYTANSQFEYLGDCLTVMTCNRLGDDDLANSCSPFSQTPVRVYDDLRRGEYVALYPCTDLIAGQHWRIILPSTSPSTSPSASPSTILPSASPSTVLPSASPSTVLPSASPSTVLPTASPSASPVMRFPLVPTYSPSIVLPLSNESQTNSPSFESNNVQNYPLYAIPISFCIAIGLVMFGLLVRRRCK